MTDSPQYSKNVVVMGIMGLIVCLFWPILFGLALSDKNGLYGIVVGLFIVFMALIYPFYNNWYRIVRLLRGVYIWAIACLVPIIPLALGFVLLMTLLSIIPIQWDDENDHSLMRGLPFFATVVMTVIFALINIGIAYGLGVLYCRPSHRKSKDLPLKSIG